MTQRPSILRFFSFTSVSGEEGQASRPGKIIQRACNYVSNINFKTLHIPIITTHLYIQLLTTMILTVAETVCLHTWNWLSGDNAESWGTGRDAWASDSGEVFLSSIEELLLGKERLRETETSHYVYFEVHGTKSCWVRHQVVLFSHYQHSIFAEQDWWCRPKQKDVSRDLWYSWVSDKFMDVHIYQWSYKLHASGLPCGVKIGALLEYRWPDLARSTLTNTQLGLKPHQVMCLIPMQWTHVAEIPWPVWLRGKAFLKVIRKPFMS